MSIKQKFLVAIFTIVVIIACIALVVFFRQQKQTGQQQQPQGNSAGKNNGNIDPKISAQLQVLDELKKQQDRNSQPQADEERQAIVQAQLQQLEEIRKISKKTPALTQQQMEDQLKQLDALVNVK